MHACRSTLEDPTPRFRWRIASGGRTLAEGDTLVSALGSVAVSRVLAPLAPGPRVIRLVADTLGAVVETDESNNASTRTLVVAGQPDTVPPVFTRNPTATWGRTSAIVLWATNEPTRGSLRYGRTPAYGDSLLTPLGSTHSLTPDGLTRGRRYYFRVAATDTAGNTTLSRPDSFTTLSNVAPVARATATPPSGPPPLVVRLSGAGSTDADGDPLTYRWDFGNGRSDSGVTVIAAYIPPGRYLVTLRVSDPYGGTGTDYRVVSVIDTNAAFPALPVLDDFNRADGSLAPDAWSDANGFAIRDGRLVQATNSYGSPVWNTLFGPNQEAYVRLGAITASSPEHDLMLKVQGTSWSKGHIEVRYDATVRRILVATYAPIGGWSTVGSFAVQLAEGDVLGARAFSNGLVAVYRNGTKLGCVSVTSWPFYALSGRLGLTLANAGDSELDDFGGGTLTGPVSPAFASDADLPGVDAPESDAPPETLATALDPAPRPAPGRLALSNAYPNPTTGGVGFLLELPAGSRVAWAIHDLQGRVMAGETRDYGAGRWVLSWNGKAASARSGVYLARVTVGSETFVRRFVLLR